MIWIRGLCIVLVALGGWAASSPPLVHASCVVETSGTYAEGTSIRDDKCFVDGAKKVSLSSYLLNEVPASPQSYISVGTTEDKFTVKDTPGSLYSISATNTAATVSYLKCENDTSANTTPGSETPEFRMAIPGQTIGAGFAQSFPLGFSFTAWTCWIVKGAADADVAEVGANEVMVFFTKK